MKLLNNIWVKGIAAVIFVVILVWGIDKIRPFMDAFMHSILYAFGAFLGMYVIIPVLVIAVLYFIIKALQRLFKKRG